MNDNTILSHILSQMEALLHQAQEIAGCNHDTKEKKFNCVTGQDIEADSPFEPTSPKELANNKRSLALSKIGTDVDKMFMVVQIKDKQFNNKRTAAIITYVHPKDTDRPLEVKQYWVTKDKIDISIWDELEVGNCYLVETHKYQKTGRAKDRWVWLSSTELPRSVAVSAQPVGKLIPKAVAAWARSL